MQQIPFIDLFFGLFESALHVSGDKLAHLQEHFWLYVQLLVQCTDIPAGRQQYRCIIPKAVYTVKSAPEDGRICRPKHVELIQIDQWKDQETEFISSCWLITSLATYCREGKISGNDKFSGKLIFGGKIWTANLILAKYYREGKVSSRRYFYGNP